MEKTGWNKYGTEYRVIEHFDGPDPATGANLAPRCAWQDSRQFLAFGANAGGGHLDVRHRQVEPAW